MRRSTRAVRILTLAALLAPAFASSGCRCGTTRTTDGGVPLDAGTLPPGFAEYIEAVCDWAVDCQGPFGPAFASREGCVSYYDDIYECFLLPLFEAFGLTFTTDAAALDACLAALDAAGCSTAAIPADVCADLFVQAAGAGNVGEPCATPFGGGSLADPCMAGLFCDYQPGVCSACIPEAVLNEDCSDRPCADGFFCDFGANLCVALVPDGGPCTFDSECVSEFCPMGSCEPPLPDGSACTSDLDCVSSLCVSDVCSSPLPAGAPCTGDEECDGFRACLGGVCSDRLPTGAACTGSGCLLDHYCSGGICTPVDGCDTLPFGISCGMDGICTGGEYCDGLTMTCMPQVPVGSACTGDSECLGDAHCDDVSMTCADPSPVGGPCTFDSDCADPLRCAPDDTCFSPLANGAPCTAPDECESEYCDGATSVCADLPACP